MKVSLIITTYNWREAIHLSLLSVFLQTRLPAEIIVADDGSRDGTGELIEKLSRHAPVPIIHSWQEDRGFRTSMSRNKAIARASGDYILLLDGDMILERHFIHDHLLAAAPGSFIQGSRVILNERKSQQILADGDITLSVFSRGIENRKNCLRSQLLSRLFSTVHGALEGIRTCNFSFWRADALAVNGFNEEFQGWGREDSEFACRLSNYGIVRKNLRFRASAYHLHHPICNRDALPRNTALLAETVREARRWCANGIDKYLTPARTASPEAGG